MGIPLVSHSKGVLFYNYHRLPDKHFMEIITPASVVEKATHILNAWGEEEPRIVTPEHRATLLTLLDRRILMARKTHTPFRTPIDNDRLRWLFYFHACRVLGFFELKQAYLWDIYEYYPRFPQKLHELLAELWPCEGTGLSHNTCST